MFKRQQLKKFFESFTDSSNPIYKDGLKCKIQEINYDSNTETYNFKFIGAHIQIHKHLKNLPLIQTQCKNWDDLRKVGSQKFLRLVHASSYTSNSVKYGTIIGEFIRQKTYTNDPDLLNTVNKKLCIELLSIGYSKKQLKNLLLRCKKHTNLTSCKIHGTG